ncbi:MAG TPA: ribosome biogenesis GTPase Der, partial [Pseudomonadales bacterium]|nr:ribosome biogenesis GTPase Der [Pseudomonadales bacterium]
MKLVLAIVGRPNVGKSTLFNRLTRSRDAIVADMPGLTRDRQYGEATEGERKFICIDTGGISGEEEGVDLLMAAQSIQAVEEATAVLFVVDGRDGLTAADEMIARKVRQFNKPVYLAVNKTDGVDPSAAAADFYQLGFNRVYTIAAAHGRGVKGMIEEVLTDFPEEEAIAELEAQSRGIRIAVVGRPNVGKSTLVNRMLGEERVIVYDMPGTTRDSIYIPYQRHGKDYTLIDTAGVRKRGRVEEGVERYSVIRTLQAIEDANVVIMVFDARESIVEQDLHLLGFVLESGRALVLTFNKWDHMEPAAKDEVKLDAERRLNFIDFARIHFISALHGTGVGDLYASVEKAYQSATKRYSASELTRLLEQALETHQPPLVRGRRIKLRYAHLGGVNPPIIVIHGNQTEEVPVAYQRFLQGYFRKRLKIEGSPIRIEFKTGDNP